MSEFDDVNVVIVGVVPPIINVPVPFGISAKLVFVAVVIVGNVPPIVTVPVPFGDNVIPVFVPVDAIVKALAVVMPPFAVITPFAVNPLLPVVIDPVLD